MQVIEIAEPFRGLGILLIAKGFRPDVLLPNDTSFLTIRDFQASTKFLRRTVRFHAFRRFREAVLQKSEARQLLIDYWMGHENDDMSTRYGKQLLEDV